MKKNAIYFAFCSLIRIFAAGNKKGKDYGNNRNYSEKTYT